MWIEDWVPYLFICSVLIAASFSSIREAVLYVVVKIKSKRGGLL